MDLVLSGEDTELDKSVIEEISDPLVHILRNSVDHGIEPLEERWIKNGKPEKGLYIWMHSTGLDLLSLRLVTTGEVSVKRRF